MSPVHHFSSHSDLSTGIAATPAPPIPFAAEMIAHARREVPNESCGLIAAEADSPVGVFPMTNADASPSTYRMDSAELLRTFEEIDDHGWDLWAIYHSHPRTPAWPSESDRRQAFYPGVRYIIVSLADASWPVLRSFWLEEGEVIPDA